jgi:hypothetical protein
METEKTYGAGSIQTSPLSPEEARELIDLLIAERSDLARANDILQERIALRDDALAAAQARIQGLQEQLDIAWRLADARVEAEAAQCSCPPKWQRWTGLGASFVVGGLAGRGSCVVR